MGMPSTAANIEGVNELVIPEGTGIMFDYQDFSTVIEAVERLGSDRKLREEMGQRAEKYAREFFNAAINIKLTTDVYEKSMQ